jgi:hypothetical protein
MHITLSGLHIRSAKYQALVANPLKSADVGVSEAYDGSNTVARQVDYRQTLTLAGFTGAHCDKPRAW